MGSPPPVHLLALDIFPGEIWKEIICCLSDPSNVARFRLASREFAELGKDRLQQLRSEHVLGARLQRVKLSNAAMIRVLIVQGDRIEPKMPWLRDCYKLAFVVLQDLVAVTRLEERTLLEGLSNLSVRVCSEESGLEPSVSINDYYVSICTTSERSPEGGVRNGTDLARAMSYLMKFHHRDIGSQYALPVSLCWQLLRLLEDTTIRECRGNFDRLSERFLQCANSMPLLRDVPPEVFELPVPGNCMGDPNANDEDGFGQRWSLPLDLDLDLDLDFNTGLDLDSIFDADSSFMKSMSARLFDGPPTPPPPLPARQTRLKRKGQRTEGVPTARQNQCSGLSDHALLRAFEGFWEQIPEPERAKHRKRMKQAIQRVLSAT